MKHTVLVSYQEEFYEPLGELPVRRVEPGIAGIFGHVEDERLGN